MEKFNMWVVDVSGQYHVLSINGRAAQRGGAAGLSVRQARVVRPASHTSSLPNAKPATQCANVGRPGREIRRFRRASIPTINGSSAHRNASRMAHHDHHLARRPRRAAAQQRNSAAAPELGALHNASSQLRRRGGQCRLFAFRW